MVSMKLLFAVALLQITCNLYYVNADERAQVIGLKRIINNFVVKGKDITVQYDIYNVGQQAASNVELDDSTFPTDYFSIKSGLKRVRWPTLAPGANVTHTLILTAQQSVVFNITQASIRYKATAESRGFTMGHTTGQEEIIVYDDGVYDKQFSAHPMEWLSFGMMTVPSILIPLALWYRSHSKYTSLISGSRKSD